jgi:hypothetical protein
MKRVRRPAAIIPLKRTKNDDNNEVERLLRYVFAILRAIEYRVALPLPVVGVRFPAQSPCTSNPSIYT